VRTERTLDSFAAGEYRFGTYYWSKSATSRTAAEIISFLPGALLQESDSGPARSRRACCTGSVQVLDPAIRAA
jgi:hypothetical protein